MLPRWLRQQILLEARYFTCACPRCSEDMHLSTDRFLEVVPSSPQSLLSSTLPSTGSQMSNQQMPRVADRERKFRQHAFPLDVPRMPGQLHQHPQTHWLPTSLTLCPCWRLLPAGGAARVLRSARTAWMLRSRGTAWVLSAGGTTWMLRSGGAARVLSTGGKAWVL